MTAVSEAGRQAARIDEQWDFDDPEGSESAFRALLEDPAAEADPDFGLQVRTQLARSLGLQRRFDEARRALDAVASDLMVDMPLTRVRYLLERGRVLNSSGDPDRAAPLFQTAWEEASAIGAEFYAIDAAHMLGIVSPPEAALRWNERALQAATAASDERARGWIGSLCNNIGWTYHGLGRFDDALAMFERALEARQASGKPREIRIARWCVARGLRSLGRVEEALARQRELEAEPAHAAQADGYVPEEIAECLHALGRTEEARPYFRRAYECLSNDPWLTEAEPDRIERLKTLGGDA